MNKKSKYLVKNSIIFFVSSFSTKILSFFLMSLYTSILSTKEYGIADLLLTTSTILIYVFTLNIGDAILRFTLEDTSKSNMYLKIGIKIFLLGSVICFSFICLFFIFDFWGIGRALYILLFLNYLLSALYGLLSSYAQGVDRIINVGVASSISASLTIVLNVIFLVFLKLRVEGLILSSIIGYLVSNFYLFIFLKLYNFKISFKYQDEKKYSKKMASYSIPLIFNGIAWWLNSAFDKYCITYMIGVDNTGVYSAASRIPIILSSLNGIFGQAWGLSAIKDVEEDDNDHFFTNSYNIYNFILTFSGSVLICLNIPLAKLLFANDFFIAWKYSSILIVSTIFNALSSFLGGAFSKSMKTKEFAKSTLISLFVNLFFNVLLISKIGLLGAALATTFSFFVLWVVRLILARNYVKLKINIFLHLLSYLLLILQICIQHYFGKFSYFQLLFILFILILYNYELRFLIHKFFKSKNI